MTERLSLQLCDRNVVTIAERLGLTETMGDDGGPFMTLFSQMGPAPVGTVRHFTGAVTLVYVGLAVEMIQLDSHMMFAFTEPASAVPHFTVDSVFTGDTFAFHLDLIPRVDLGAHLDYMDVCFTPLTPVREAGMAIEGLQPAPISPRQWALMSEWMMVHRADESAFRAIEDTVAQYREHWFSLVDRGVPDSLLNGVTPEQLTARNSANLSAIFNPDVDPVWANVERLVGPETSESIRSLLARAGELEVTP